MKRKSLIGLCLVILVLLTGCRGLKSPEQYEIGEDRVDSLTTVVGSLKLTNISHDIADTAEKKTYIYSKVDGTPEKIQEYVLYLHDEEGFYVLEKDITFGTSTGEASMARLSEDGEDILFMISYRYDLSTIEIEVIKGEGFLDVWSETTTQINSEI